MTTTTSGTRVTNPETAPGDLAALEQTLKDATKKAPASAPTGATQPEGQTTTKPDYIQEKFWNGNEVESLRKQAEAYPSLQSAYGRMANDLGTQRKLTDQLLALDKRATDLEGTPAAVKTAPKVNARDLVDKPTETLDAYWKQREADLRAEMDAREQKYQAAAAERDFLAKHADFQIVTQSPEFMTWVHSSPLRQRAAALAGTGNYVVADELLTEYKIVKGQAPDKAAAPDRGTTTNSNTTVNDAARKAVLETAASTGGAAGKGSTYRRSDLIKLKMEKPQVYADPAFQNEILRAYAEGRVK